VTANPPRILFCAASSGSGKTTLTCAVLQALVNRGLSVSSFKCGPDYIDPMFHSRVIGTKSRNLDPFFLTPDLLRYSLCKNSAQDFSLIEGVMGYYDGLAGISDQASSYQVAVETKTPAVLIVDGRGVSVSAAATVTGFLRFRENSQIQGVILNRVSPMAYSMLKEVIERETGIKVYGYLPVMKDCALESRHLGLVTAGEVKGLREKLSLLAEQAEKTIDLDGLMELAHEAPSLTCEPPVVQQLPQRISIAVAEDEAFCFYYEDNFDLLKQMGINFVPFSPLKDQKLPAEAAGLILGGGYPELYVKELSENRSMRESIQNAVKQGMPTIAECGGFMYLQQTLDGFPMAGALPGNCAGTGKLSRFGYVTLTANRDSMLCKQGEQIPAHEFHYWDSDCCGDGFTASKPLRQHSWQCGVVSDRLYAGYPHLHLMGNLSFAWRFAKACFDFMEQTKGQK
jgi:cobyrinic acid a,c-diamide synthase